MAVEYLLLGPPKDQWSEALANYDMATRDLEPKGLDDDEINLLADAQAEAIFAVMRAKAPDMAAFARKLEIFIAEDCPSFMASWMAEGLLSDARRLGGLQ